MHGLAIAVTSDDCLVATLTGGIDRNISVTVPSLHHLVQQSRRLISDPKCVGDHAREGRIRQQADEFFVVDANDSDFFGHGHAGTAACIEHLNAANIIARHDSQWLGQSLDPPGDSLDLVFPRSLLVAPRDAANGQAFVNSMASSPQRAP